MLCLQTTWDCQSNTWIFYEYILNRVSSHWLLPKSNHSIKTLTRVYTTSILSATRFESNNQKSWFESLSRVTLSLQLITRHFTHNGQVNFPEENEEQYYPATSTLFICFSPEQRLHIWNQLIWQKTKFSFAKQYPLKPLQQISTLKRKHFFLVCWKIFCINLSLKICSQAWMKITGLALLQINYYQGSRTLGQNTHGFEYLPNPFMYSRCEIKEFISFIE